MEKTDSERWEEEEEEEEGQKETDMRIRGERKGNKEMKATKEKRRQRCSRYD